MAWPSLENTWLSSSEKSYNDLYYVMEQTEDNRSKIVRQTRDDLGENVSTIKAYAGS